LVFGYHGSANSNNPDTMISLTGSMRTSTNNEAIFVYPDGHINGVPNNWEKNEEGKDIQFFDDLLVELENKYCINSSKIFVVGFSDGGGMVNSLGCYRSTVIRGAAEASGYLPQKNKCGDSPMPFFIWHGRADTITDFTTYAAPEIDHWKKVNGCNDATSSIPPSSEECVSYDSCTKARLVTCTPNVDHGFPATLGEPIWNFFESL
jgi:polyhydroxybutyrate depolymerase